MQTNLKLIPPQVLYQSPAGALHVAPALPRRRKPFIPSRDGVRAVALLLIAVALLALTFGCAGAPPTLTPQIMVFTVKAGYETSLTGMVAYARLPRCTPANTPVCSRQDLIDQLERARTTARAAIDAAEGAVRTPGFGTDALATAVTAADAATKALTAITIALPRPK